MQSKITQMYKRCTLEDKMLRIKNRPNRTNSSVSFKPPLFWVSLAGHEVTKVMPTLITADSHVKLPWQFPINCSFIREPSGVTNSDNTNVSALFCRVWLSPQWTVFHGHGRFSLLLLQTCGSTFTKKIDGIESRYRWITKQDIKCLFRANLWNDPEWVQVEIKFATETDKVERANVHVYLSDNHEKKLKL